MSRSRTVQWLIVMMVFLSTIRWVQNLGLWICQATWVMLTAAPPGGWSYLSLTTTISSIMKWCATGKGLLSFSQIITRWLVTLTIFLRCFRPNHLVRWFFGENALLGRFMIVWSKIYRGKRIKPVRLKLMREVCSGNLTTSQYVFSILWTFWAEAEIDWPLNIYRIY